MEGVEGGSGVGHLVRVGGGRCRGHKESLRCKIVYLYGINRVQS